MNEQLVADLRRFRDHLVGQGDPRAETVARCIEIARGYRTVDSLIPKEEVVSLYVDGDCHQCGHAESHHSTDGRVTFCGECFKESDAGEMNPCMTEESTE